jgi:hypothetical protein
MRGRHFFALAAVAVSAVVVAALLGAFGSTARSSSGAAAGLDGVKIHGNWQIDVRRPDGTLVGRHRFHNDLQQTGMYFLAAALGRASSFGRWDVFNSGPTCAGSAGGATGCDMAEADDPSTADFVVKTLTVTRSASAPYSMSLSGQYTAKTAGDIYAVTSETVSCPYDGPLCGGYTTSSPFSYRVLPSPIPVAAGQIVQTTVTFTFS